MESSLYHFHHGLKAAFESVYLTGVFEETLSPKFDLKGGHVVGSAVTYELLGTLHFDMISVMLKYALNTNSTFVVESYEPTEIRWFIKNATIKVVPAPNRSSPNPL